MMRGASGDEYGNLVLGQEYNRPAEAGVLKKPRGSDFNFNSYLNLVILLSDPFKRQQHLRTELSQYLLLERRQN
jgi:hypothetical protein